MLTREYLRGLRGTDRREVPQPVVYPTEDRYPAAYSVRDLQSKDAIAAIIESFEPV